ncbi:MAG: hypothetical protein V1827_02390 [Candidatus Micrarchaeota archaeon]
MRPVLSAILLLCIASVSFAQLYDVYLIRVNDSNVTDLVYDDAGGFGSYSYADNSMENPDVSVRVCTANPGDLLNRWVALAYADGADGDYIQVSSWPLQVTSVAPNGCAIVPLDVDSFAAWYPSIPYVFVANDASLAGSSRWKLSKSRGWMVGNYTTTVATAGNEVNITVTSALDDLGNPIPPDVDFLVIGLTRPDSTTMDTAISSPNDMVSLLSDGGNYSIFINGIGPDTAPFVTIITPEPIIYTTQTIPFTFTITDDDSVSSCWYVLDGVNTTLPDCTASYILTVPPGAHTLWLYANDSSGQIGSDSVAFTVSTGAPRPPEGGGGGGTQTPYWPVVPPQPPSEAYFSISPEDIWVIIDYPQEGRTDFTLSSDTVLTDLECFVVGDFGPYTSVELDSESIEANGTLSGTMIVGMSPAEILDYDKGMSGYLQCVGKSSPTLTASALANVYLVINKPYLEMENRTYEALPGTQFNGTAPIRNIGDGNATVINVTALVRGRPYNVTIYSLPGQLAHLQEGAISFGVGIPPEMKEGVTVIEVEFYENGRLIGKGYIIVRVLPEIPKPPPEMICSYPDLTWTLVILLIGMIVSVITFRRKVKEENDGKHRFQGQG